MSPPSNPQIAQQLLKFYNNDPKRWTQRQYACYSDGYACDPLHSEAACWCLVGAMTSLGLDEFRVRFSNEFGRAAVAGGYGYGERALLTFNDSHTFEQVMARLKEVAS